MLRAALSTRSLLPSRCARLAHLVCSGPAWPACDPDSTPLPESWLRLHIAVFLQATPHPRFACVCCTLTTQAPNPCLPRGTHLRVDLDRRHLRRLARPHLQHIPQRLPIRRLEGDGAHVGARLLGSRRELRTTRGRQQASALQPSNCSSLYGDCCRPEPCTRAKCRR